MNWIISANSKMYDHSSSFEHYSFVDWRQGFAKFQVNDIVYIYSTKPTQKIQYKCKVEKIDLDFNNIRDDREYWKDESEYFKSLEGKFMRLSLIEQVYSSQMNLNKLLENGLKAAPQGPKKIDGQLLEYIEANFTDSNQNDIYPDSVNENTFAYEGLKKMIFVNKYERSSIARNKCIEYYGGAICQVCLLDFSERYGELGKGFIHMHHKVPIHKIGIEYKVNYEEDLIPVCPNCHAMLHRKINGREIGVEELKTLLKS